MSKINTIEYDVMLEEEEEEEEYEQLKWQMVSWIKINFVLYNENISSELKKYLS